MLPGTPSGLRKAKLLFFSRFNFPAFLVMLTLALGQQGNGRIYLPNVRQPETVRFPGWGWLLSACPRYVGEQGPEKLCHGDSENQAPWPVPRPTGATREPHQDTLETVSAPSVSHSLHTGPQPVRGPGGSTWGTHCTTRTTEGCHRAAGQGGGGRTARS